MRRVIDDQYAFAERPTHALTHVDSDSNVSTVQVNTVNNTSTDTWRYRLPPSVVGRGTDGGGGGDDDDDDDDSDVTLSLVAAVAESCWAGVLPSTHVSIINVIRNNNVDDDSVRRELTINVGLTTWLPLAMMPRQAV